MSAAALVAASAAVSGLGCALLLTSGSFMTMVAGASLAGFSFAAVFPVTLAFAADRSGGRVATAFGLLFTAALIGGMLLPWAIGRMSQTVGLQRAMALPLLSAAAVAMLAPRLRAR